MARRARDGEVLIYVTLKSLPTGLPPSIMALRIENSVLVLDAQPESKAA